MWRSDVLVCVLVATVLLAGASAHAEVRGVVRVGVMPLHLESSKDTLLFGDQVDSAVYAYNLAVAAYDLQFGTTTEKIDASDLGVSDTLVTLTPGIEATMGAFFVRAEAQLGIGDELRAVGVGLYPLNFQVAFTRALGMYVSAGGSASWLDRAGAGGIGGLLALRAAGGFRILRHIVVEAGYGISLGGVVDLDPLLEYVPSASSPPPSPTSVIVAGEARGVVDVSIGVVF
jgi:hypothetical protein